MTPTLPIALDREALAEFCRSRHITRLALFGSVLRDDFGADSDIDEHVEFKEGKTPGLGFARIQRELSEMLGREVDLMTPGGISKYFRDEVLGLAEVVYEASGEQ